VSEIDTIDTYIAKLEKNVPTIQYNDKITTLAKDLI